MDNDDLISRFDAIAELDHVYGRLGNIDMSGSELSDELEDIVLGLPSVQPKTGHWIASEDYDGDVYYTCSVCEEPWVTIEGTPQENRMRYCPHCGAKMGGDADEQ